METCPVELTTLIVEYACSSDSGQTARSIGLVSKYFRAIAEPIELRAIAISGLKQLHGAVSRLNSIQTSQKLGLKARAIDIRHLFICELSKEHAIAADIGFGYWCTQRGAEAAESYSETIGEFWELAGYLVRSASRSLQTLFLSTSGNWRIRRLRNPNNRKNPKLLGVLSGTAFPKLTSLTLIHNAVVEMPSSVDSGLSFQLPAIPRLQKLQISSRLPSSTDQGQTFQWNDPLLPIIRSEVSDITHLVIYQRQGPASDRALEYVFGENWTSSLSGGTLPGKLKSVIFKQGIAPRFRCGLSHSYYRTSVENFVRTITELGVKGLVAQLPTFMRREVGQTEYELLLAEWKEECFSNLH